ncbi:hypothetical protein GOP47_0026311 [Adiantum capillus-veneris]|nr:hypothetical protein GOP47_0026311 [Adiantum capillus-veneris]
MRTKGMRAEDEAARVPPALSSSVVGLATVAEKAFAAAEAAEKEERAACRVAQRAVEAYCKAAVRVNLAECSKLLSIAKSAQGMTETVTDSAAHSSKEYMSHKIKTSADPSVALKATQSALYTREKSDTVASFIKRSSLATPLSFKRDSTSKLQDP